ncbi:MAG: class I SAM-dependent methyltransferase [Actinomycetota bacterium]
MTTATASADTGSTPVLRVTGSELADALAEQSVDRPFGVVLTVASLEELGDPMRSARRVHHDLLARACVGLAVVGPDEVTATSLEYAGEVPFPLTALGEPALADGWIAGQVAAGIDGIRPAGAGKTIGLPATWIDHVQASMSQPLDPIAQSILRSAMDTIGHTGMTIDEDQGRFMKLLVELSGARTIVEVGTFIGTSALWMARGLPADGKLTCFDIETTYVDIGRPAWEEAGVADKIDVVIGPAIDGLRALPNEPTIDMAFIDADKTGYASYVDELLPRLAPGGFIAIDNTLWSGDVANPNVVDDDTVALRALSADLAHRDDLDVLLLTIGDGVTIVRRRADPAPAAE